MTRPSSQAPRLRPERIELREARASELESLAESGFRSFRSADRELWLRNVFQDNPNLAPRDTLVARIGGKIAGHASGYRFTMSLAGRDVPMRGVAAVAVAPEFRRRGVADVLLRGLLRQMRRRGDALSMLYAFRMSFYRKFGWGIVEWADHVRARPSQLPASPLRKNVRALVRPDDALAVMRLYERARHAWTGPFVRHARWWDIRVWSRANEGVKYVNPATRGIEGYALYDVPPDPPYPRQVAFVREFIATSPEAFRGLLGYFEALGDQYQSLELALPKGEATGLLEDFGMAGTPESLRMFQTVGLASGGAMLRLVDVPAALGLHPAPAENGARGRIGIDLEDRIVAAQNTGFDVTFGARGAKAVAGRAARDRVRLTAAQLAQVYGGGVSAVTLLRQGRASGSARAAAVLDEAFAGPPTFLLPFNGF